MKKIPRHFRISRVTPNVTVTCGQATVTSLCVIVCWLLALPLVAQPYDLLIRNGRVVDGTGNPWYYADVAVKNGKVAYIGQVKPSDAKAIIDARGQIVAPGFIDIHTHLEGGIEDLPTADNFLYDGVTTAITGNCGLSRTNLRGYFDSLRTMGISLNMASFIGHNALRYRVMKNAFREPTAREQNEMEALTEQAMKEGAVGLSTGLVYIPGTYAKTPEVVNLAKVSARYNGIYASHMRNEGNQVVASIQEAIQVGREANLPVQISHFKIDSKPLWGTSTRTISLVKEARLAGLDVTVDQYPYTAGSTTLTFILPAWALADSDSIVMARFRDPATRAKIRDEMLDNLQKNGRTNYDYAVVANAPMDATLNGLSVTQINQRMGRKNDAATEIDLILELLLKARMKRIAMVYHLFSEDDVETIMRYPNTMIASDGRIMPFNVGAPHPRYYGTNARVLGHYVREKKIITLEDAIRRMTSLPAQRIGFSDRGLLKPGYAADIVVFDEKTVIDRATFEAPHAYADGFSYVLVNGVPVIENGKHNGQRPGHILLGKGHQ